jgi:hypothetical protein
MSKITDGGSAFHGKVTERTGFGVDEWYERGMTKREYYAVLAMQGLAAANRYTAADCARQSVAHADALITELAKDKP